MSRKYFGTDGVRGRANTHPMTAELALKLGAAAGRAMDWRRLCGATCRYISASTFVARLM